MTLALLEAIGTDRYLSAGECPAIGAHERGAEAWALYQSHFDGYCEAALDPLFNRLRLPVRTTGRLVQDEGPIVVVGTGPSLTAALPDLVRLRPRLRLATSPRGATVLKQAGIVPDLVLVEHRTALDAHHTARFQRDGVEHPLAGVSLVATEWRTPAHLLEGLSATVFVPDRVPSWGLWPATLAAMAVEAGAASVALVGVDLGTATQPDPAFEPLVRLLGLVARLSPRTRLLDCGGGAPKTGWRAASLDEAVGPPSCRPLAIEGRPAPALDERVAVARAALEALREPCARAREFLSLASQRVEAAGSALERAAAELMAWRHEATLRTRLQGALGLSFLPRIWRRGLAPDLGGARWRPVLLATHELVSQADRLAAEVGA
jgi:hypothetical protein